MLLLRFLSGVVVAMCVVLLITPRPVRLACVQPAASVDRGPPRAAPAHLVPHSVPPFVAHGAPTAVPINVVDVAPGLPAVRLAALVGLRPDEHVTAVNDRALASDLEAGVVIASLAPRRGGFVDLTVSSAAGERRVLLLIH